MDTQIVSRRYNLDPTNMVAFLAMFCIGKGFIGRIVIDMFERTPFHFPEECPARSQAVIEAMEKYLAVDGIRTSITNIGQIITLNRSEIPGAPKATINEKEDTWDSYGESFEDYVIRIVGDESYRMEVYEDIIPAGAGDEYRKS